MDNIGLNGLLIVEGQTERDFFITAAKIAPPGTRLFHLRATADGGQASKPVLIRVLPGGALSLPFLGNLPVAGLTLEEIRVAIARRLREDASLLDPRAARHLERSLAAVVDGRTVVAIAHRLHTAHDADRVAVVEDGLIAEFGSHDDLVAAGGSYAALWESWHGKG